MNDTKNTKTVLKLSLILFTITFVATLLLTLCNYITKDRISMLEKQKADEAKQSVIENAEFRIMTLDKEVRDKYASFGPIEAYRAVRDGKFAGYCINLQPSGYIGKINMIIGINPDSVVQSSLIEVSDVSSLIYAFLDVSNLYFAW